MTIIFKSNSLIIWNWALIMSLDFTDDKSIMVQVIAWCLQAPSHYLIQCWLGSMSQYGITRPQWVKLTWFSYNACYYLVNSNQDWRCWWLSENGMWLKCISNGVICLCAKNINARDGQKQYRCSALVDKSRLGRWWGTSLPYSRVPSQIA